MDTGVIIKALLGDAVQKREGIEQESEALQNSIMQLQQRLNQLAQAHFTVSGEEAAYRKLLVEINKAPTEPPIETEADRALAAAQAAARSASEQAFAALTVQAASGSLPSNANDLIVVDDAEQTANLA